MPEIYIKDLIVLGKHGIHAHEKQNAQRFSVSVKLTTGNDGAFISDDLNDTINWSFLKQTIISTVQDNSYNLVERLAQEIADKILQYEYVKKVTVSVDKLDAFESGVPGVKLSISRK